MGVLDACLVLCLSSPTWILLLCPSAGVASIQGFRSVGNLSCGNSEKPNCTSRAAGAEAGGCSQQSLEPVYPRLLVAGPGDAGQAQLRAGSRQLPACRVPAGCQGSTTGNHSAALPGREGCSRRKLQLPFRMKSLFAHVFVLFPPPGLPLRAALKRGPAPGARLSRPLPLPSPHSHQPA